MKWTSLLPLLIWAIGWAAVMEWSEHLYAIDGRELTESIKTAGAMLWLLGCAFFFIMGVAFIR